MDYSSNHRIGTRAGIPRMQSPHPRARGVVSHAFQALDGWYVVSDDGVWTVEPDHDSLMLWCVAHVRAHMHDTIIIHHDAPVEPS
ncbi:MAG TPA: hypothetical protein VEL07_22380 [Planctomycetota bacterium]|nr:hypothetical protein [Planctomycetota bacterium]